MCGGSRELRGSVSIKQEVGGEADVSLDTLYQLLLASLGCCCYLRVVAITFLGGEITKELRNWEIFLL